jgi:hypothetical protein
MDKMEKIMDRQYNMKINKGKMKILVRGRHENAWTQVQINDQLLKQGRKFTYLGSKITKDGRSKKETASRINPLKPMLV